MAASKGGLIALALLGLLFGPGASAQSSAHGEHSAARPAAVRPMSLPWTPEPSLRAAGRPGERGAMPFVVSGFEPDRLEVFGPSAPNQARSLERESGRWILAPDEGGGFHWIEGVQRQSARMVRAATLWSFPGKGASPANVLQRAGDGLEIRPLRIPERGGYRESSRWDFRLLFDGRPLAGHELLLLTENGSRQTFKSDAEGRVEIIFPRDFKSESIDSELGAARTRKAYLLQANWQQGAVLHESSFSYFYTPDPLRERSLGWGIGFMALGMVCALPLLRRRPGASHA